MDKPASWKKYGLALVVSLLAIGLKYLFDPIIGSVTPFLLFFSAVLISSWYGGLIPGLITSLICSLAGGLFSAPVGDFGYQTIIRTVIFMIEGTLLSILNEQRKITDQRLADTKEHARIIVAAVQEFAIIALNPDGKIVSWNPAAEKIFGYKDSEIINQPFRRLFEQKAERENAVEQELQQALTMGSAPDEHWHIRKDGSKLWASGTTSVIYKDGNVAGFVKVLRDNTKLKQAEAERDHLLQHEVILRREAEAANRMKDEFLATVSHELRTPLTAILGWTRLLRDGRLNQPQLETRAMETIERNARLQAQIIDDLLDVSRIITGNLRLEIARTDLIPVIDAAIDSLLPAANAKNISLIKNYQIDVDPVNGDAGRLQQVVWNLLSNAIKFTANDGRVDISLRRVADQVELKISDNGRGISKEFIPYIFDRFRQADSTSTRKYGGLGLGLSIVRHMIELHGGTVQVNSAGENQGTTFTIMIPRARSQANQSQSSTLLLKRPVTIKNQATTIMLPKTRVLIVDDEPSICELFLAVLSQAGAEVSIANSSLEAWQILQERPIDIIICDIALPAEDGYWLIKKVRSSSNNLLRSLPVIALTAYARKDDRFKSLNAGFNMHITKPVEPAELIQVIAEMTNQQKPKYKEATVGRRLT